MSALSKILGHDSISDEILDRLLGCPTQKVLITGPSGTGKTWLARSIGARWRDAGGIALRVEGDSLNASRGLFPFHATLSRVSASHDFPSSPNQDTKSLARLQQKPMTVKSIFEHILRANTSHQQSQILDKEEHAVLGRLQHAARSRQLLLILDNFHWFDRRSLRLVATLCSQALQNFEFLSTMRVLAVKTDSSAQPPVCPTFLRELTRSIFKERWNLSYATRAQFPSVLKALGCGAELSETAANLLYRSCRGHLLLASRLTDFLNAAPRESLTEEHLNQTGLVNQLLLERLTLIGESGTRLRRILEIASIIGSSFQAVELQCLTEERECELARLLEEARKLLFIEVAGSRALFSHEFIRSFFADRLGNASRQYHGKFAECLRVLRPAEFLFRHYHLKLAGSTYSSETMLVLAILQCVREGKQPNVLSEDNVTAELSRPSLVRYLEQMSSGYDIYLLSEYGAALNVLEQLDFDYPKVLLAERDYLYALCKLELHSKAGRSEAIDLLKAWDEYHLTEPDIGTRLQLLLLHAFVLSGQLDSAKTLQRRLVGYLSERASFDPASRAKIHVLNRRAGAIFSPEIATSRIRRAVEYFGPTTPDGPARNPMEYYKSLSNLAGNLLENGEYTEAYKCVQQLESFVDNTVGISFLRLDVPANNKVIAGFRSEVFSASEAFQLQREVAKAPQASTDTIIHRINQAVYQALAGDLRGSLAALVEIDNEMARQGNDETYLTYYLQTNMIADYFLLGYKEKAAHLYSELTPFIESLQWPEKPFVVERHLLLPSAFQFATQNEPRRWDTFFLETYPERIGPPWRHHGRGYLLCDLQFWAES